MESLENLQEDKELKVVRIQLLSGGMSIQSSVHSIFGTPESH